MAIVAKKIAKKDIHGTILRPHKYIEHHMSECKYGCKVYRCYVCGHEQVLHNSTYGCKEA